jgi:RCC1 and BTB domain-containing protein
MFTSKELKKYQIKQVECGCYHTIAISIENNIYTFGRNSHGQLGDGTTTNTSEPNEIKMVFGDHAPPEVEKMDLKK